jgi:hypothetical protein
MEASMQAEDIPMYRLYGELAWLWPAMSPPAEYAEEAAHWRELLRETLGPGRHPILELGVGGGHNLSHFASEFAPVAVDLSDSMLVHSRRLNPTVEHHVGDMRSIRLGHHFKAVLIHDAISHMLDEDDLLASLRTAAAHLEPGGLLLAAPDRFEDSFDSPEVDSGQGSTDGLILTYFEYTHRAQRTVPRVETILTYVIEQRGTVPGGTGPDAHRAVPTGNLETAVWRGRILLRATMVTAVVHHG